MVSWVAVHATSSQHKPPGPGLISNQKLTRAECDSTDPRRPALLPVDPGQRHRVTSVRISSSPAWAHSGARYNLKDYWWHHHVVLHELGWALTVHPDGTSQVQSPDGKTIRSPPLRPG